MGESVQRSTTYGRRKRWGSALCLAAVIAAGVGLRMYGLYGRSIWFDEAFSRRTIQFALPELVERTGHDIHVPFYYIALKSWAAVFGESLVSLRSMNLPFSALAMLGLYLWASEAFQARHGSRARGQWIGLVTAAFYGVSLYQIRLAWEIRMYTLGTALLAFSSWLLFRALLSPVQRSKPWLAYALVTLLFLYTHYFASLRRSTGPLRGRVRFPEARWQRVSSPDSQRFVRERALRA